MGRQHLSHKDKAQQIKENRDTRCLISSTNINNSYSYGPGDPSKEQMGDLADSAIQP